MFSTNFSGNSGSGVASQVNRKARESMKRCQSVEVLARNKLEPDNKPPPLPPKATTTSSASTVESVLNSEALSNDKIQLTENTSVSSAAPKPPGKSSSTTLTKKQPQTSTEASSTVIASLRRPFHGRRRSAGLLFGVEEKELPKTGVVDSTRKIFESRPGSASSSANGSSRLLMKSRSTSSLYGRNPSSSPVRRTLRQQSTDQPTKKHKDLHLSSTTTKPRTASPAKTTTGGSSSKSLVSNSTTKPALPAKPELKSTSNSSKKYQSNNSVEAADKKKKNNKFEVPQLRHVDKKQQQRQDWNKNTTASKVCFTYESSSFEFLNF